MSSFPLSPFAPLPLSDTSQKWLVSVYTTSEAYTVYLTDLSTMYIEHLSSQEILDRADDNESPIDPSMSQKQFDLLLEKLRNALTKHDSSTTVTLVKKPAEVSITTRIQLTSRVHLTWTFNFLPHGSSLDLVAPLADMGMYYYSLTSSLVTLLQRKDIHIQALREKLHDMGGSYSPRKQKDALEQFSVDKWREQRRKYVECEDVWSVFQWWGNEPTVRRDWEAIVVQLGKEPKRTKPKPKEQEASVSKTKRTNEEEDEFVDLSNTKRKRLPRGKDNTADKFEITEKVSTEEKSFDKDTTVHTLRPFTASSPAKEEDSKNEFADLDAVRMRKIPSTKKPVDEQPPARHEKPPIAEDDLTEDEEDLDALQRGTRSASLKESQDFSRSISPVHRKSPESDDGHLYTRSKDTQMRRGTSNGSTDGEDAKSKRQTMEETKEEEGHLRNRISKKQSLVDEISDEESSLSPPKKPIISKISRKPTKSPEPPLKKQIQAHVAGRGSLEEPTSRKQIHSRITGGKPSEDTLKRKQVVSRIGGRKQSPSPTLEMKVEDEPEEPVKREMTVEERAEERREKLKRELAAMRGNKTKKIRRF